LNLSNPKPRGRDPKANRNHTMIVVELNNAIDTPVQERTRRYHASHVSLLSARTTDAVATPYIVFENTGEASVIASFTAHRTPVDAHNGQRSQVGIPDPIKRADLQSLSVSPRSSTSTGFRSPSPSHGVSSH